MSEQAIINLITPFAVIIVLVIFNFSFFKKRILKNFQSTCDEHGLQIINPQAGGTDLKLAGSINGKEIEIGTIVQGSGKHRSYLTYARFSCQNPQNREFKIYREGILSKLGKSLGGQDIQIGDPEFDKTFIVKGDEMHMPIFLSADLRAEFLEMVKQKNFTGTLELKGNLLTYSSMGLMIYERIKRPFVAMLPLLARVARKVDGAR